MPDVGATLIRKASSCDSIRPLTALVSVTVRGLLAPEALIARPPAAVVRIVPALVIRRPVELVVQLIAGVAPGASVPPASTVSVSVPPTVFAVVSVVPWRTTIAR